MLGKSSRFFEAGYELPKYELPLGESTLFAQCVKSFSASFTSFPFLFLVRKDYGGRNFVLNQLASLDIQDARVIEFDDETRGQANSVFLGLEDYGAHLPLMIFNVDTVRVDFTWPKDEEFGDGFLEVFRSEGDNWSFVEPSDENFVGRVTEKERISDLCSNGIYAFSSIGLFREAYRNHDYSLSQEEFIAPIYNYLIEKGYQVTFRIADASQVYHCGLPSDYEKVKLADRFSSKG